MKYITGSIISIVCMIAIAMSIILQQHILAMAFVFVMFSMWCLVIYSEMKDVGSR